jgi:hypothetical protein
MPKTLEGPLTDRGDPGQEDQEFSSPRHSLIADVGFR